MQRHGHNHVNRPLRYELCGAARQQSPERFSEGYLATVFEFLHHLAQGMFGQFFPWIAGPSTRCGKTRRTLKTNSTSVIITAGVGKRPAACFTQRMGNRLNLRPTGRAEIFGVPTVNSPCASAATRRIKPVHQPIKTLGEIAVSDTLRHKSEIIKIAALLAKKKSRRALNNLPLGNRKRSGIYSRLGFDNE